VSFQTELLNNSHKKENFCCGNDLLDRYFHEQAKQDIKRKISICFVLHEKNVVKGYYTLSNASLERINLPEEIIKKLPSSYKNLPVTLLGRLAIDNHFKGQKLGELLLIDALRRAYETSVNAVASMAVVVDPIDNQAKNFYSKYGFIVLPDSEKMFLPMKTIAELF
jgi:predicted GNAT family N-acyltransferase